MSFVRSNLPCPDCGSSDARAEDEHWSKCFSCGKNTPLDQVDHQEVEVSNLVLNEDYDASEGVVYRDWQSRKIKLATMEKYGVGFRGQDIVFPFGEKTSAKVRVGGKKDFRIEGNWKGSGTLFGQEAFSNNDKFVIVLEGEADAMAAHQMLSMKTPCVSVRNGVASALKDVKANFDWLDGFDTVLFCFDNDAVGQEAQQKCAELFSHKAKVMKHHNNMKDACEYLEDNRTADFVNMFWRAERWTPDGIISGDSLYDAVMKPLEKADCDYPFDGLNKLTYGIRKGELVTVTAGSGLACAFF